MGPTRIRTLTIIAGVGVAILDISDTDAGRLRDFVSAAS